MEKRITDAEQLKTGEQTFANGIKRDVNFKFQKNNGKRDFAGFLVHFIKSSDKVVKYGKIINSKTASRLQ